MIAIEMCAGAGGQALGLHAAGFQHAALVELDKYACETLRQNNTNLKLGWQEIIEGDLKEFAGSSQRFKGKIDLLAGGVPCPPFSKAGLQLGHADERDLFPTALSIVDAIRPKVVMLENVPGLLEEKFTAYRHTISGKLSDLGYQSEWHLLQASDFGVPQLRPRVILVGFQGQQIHNFKWPEATTTAPITVGQALYDLIAANGWEGAGQWKKKANSIAPTLVGGSKKHGGPDLGPTRAKKRWLDIGINAHRLADMNEVPGSGFKGAYKRDGSIQPGCENLPLLNIRMAARIQGFPDYWEFSGGKTHAYRQVGNAFPPPVAKAMGDSIIKALRASAKLEYAA